MLSMTGVLFLPGPSRLHKERGSEGEEHLEPHHLSCLSAPSLFTVSEVASLINSPGLFLPVVTVSEFTKANHYTLCSPDARDSDLPSEAVDGYLKHFCHCARFEFELHVECRLLDSVL